MPEEWTIFSCYKQIKNMKSRFNNKLEMFPQRDLFFYNYIGKVPLIYKLLSVLKKTYLFIRTRKATSIKILTPAPFIQKRYKWTPTKFESRKARHHQFHQIINSQNRNHRLLYTSSWPNGVLLINRRHKILEIKFFMEESKDNQYTPE